MARSTAFIERLEGRPLLVAIAALNAVLGLASLAVLLPVSFGGDVDIFRRGANGVAQGVMAQDFLYAPLFAVLATPLTWVPFAAAAVAMSAVGLLVLVVGVAIETRGLAVIDRLLVAVAVLGFLPIVYELVIGQVTLLMAAAVFPLRDTDGWPRGLAFGLVLGLIPKPMLAPLLFWMLLYRRRALASAMVTTAAVTALGLALLGPDLYRTWGAALVGTGQVTRHGNIALDALEPPLLAGLLWIASVVIAAWVIARREAAGFVAALVVAMLVQPFTLTYAVSILLLAVRPGLREMPRATRWLSLIANPAVLVAFAPWMLAGLGACALNLRDGGRTRRAPQAEPDHPAPAAPTP